VLLPPAINLLLQVQSIAAAAFRDQSSKPMTAGTYAYLEVVCPR